MPAPFFSVLVPTYNHAAYLGAALDSLAAQTEPDWEAVVVDDGSTDRTPDLLADYARREPRVRPHRQANGGTAAALNAALERATGRWVCWLSSDDLYVPEALAIHRSAIAANPGRAFFYSHFHYLLEAEDRLAWPEPWKPTPEQPWQVLELLHGVFVHGNSICVEREAFLAAGRFDPAYPRAQDYAMWLRLLAQHPAAYTPERTCITRVHAGQTTHGFPRACFYDSARAALDFLAHTEFPALLPGTDLADPAQAAAAAAKAVELGSDRAALLYALGPHPALFHRVLQWCLDPARSPARAAGLAAFRQAAGAALERLGDAPLGAVLGRALAAAGNGCGLAIPDDPWALARGWLAAGAGGDPAEARDLRRYLDMMGRNPEPEKATA